MTGFRISALAILLLPCVSLAQTVMDDPGITVDPGGALMHRAPVRDPLGASGVVSLEASLNVKGEVSDAHVLSGPDDLRKESLLSVLQWHYSPGPARVQISLRFDPPAASPRPEVSSTVPRLRAVISPLPPSTAPTNQRTITSIEIAGFSAEAERELRSRIPVHEGDAVTPETMLRLSDVVKEFDSHAVAVVLQKPTPAGNSDLTIHISVVSQPVIALQPPVPSGDSPGPRLISDGVMAANKIRNATPVYPPLAKSARIQGKVKFDITIAQDGTVREAQLISGHPLLVQAAKDAVMQWVYQPTLLNGAPTEVRTTVEVNFSLLP